MTKPNEYRESYIVMHSVPYRNTDMSYKGSHASEGMLHEGRVVWLRDQLRSTDGATQVSAYAEGVGLVLLDSRRLEHLSRTARVTEHRRRWPIRDLARAASKK